jgi:hypothetical protein
MLLAIHSCFFGPFCPFFWSKSAGMGRVETRARVAKRLAKQRSELERLRVTFLLKVKTLAERRAARAREIEELEGAALLATRESKCTQGRS